MLATMTTQAPATYPTGARGRMVVGTTPVSFNIIGTHTDGRILVKVTNLHGLKTDVQVGEVIAIPAARIDASPPRPTGRPPIGRPDSQASTAPPKEPSASLLRKSRCGSPSAAGLT